MRACCSFSATFAKAHHQFRRRCDESDSSSKLSSSVGEKRVRSNQKRRRRRSAEALSSSSSSSSEAMTTTNDVSFLSVDELKRDARASSSSFSSSSSSSSSLRNEFVQISKASPPPPAENLSKLQQFGRKYWPALAILELLALIGASLNGVLSRKRRQEIERLNIQMRQIMQRVEEERFERHNTKTAAKASRAMELIGKAKSAYANGEYDVAIDLFTDAVAAADDETSSEEDKIEESLSARKGLATAYQASGDLTKAASALESALLVAKDSTVFGMLGDVYTDMGELSKAGEMYDKCLEAMD